MNKLDLETKNIVDDNIVKIGSILPNVIVESENGQSIDFDLLKQELSSVLIEGNKEKYQLTWPGKKESIVNANTPTIKTLRPIKEKSVDFDNTENVYIEGDNLEVLKILQESYLNKIKCIYIDPPYNTGNDFIYNDKFLKSKEEELEKSGQIDEYGNRMVSNSQSNGKYHSDWLSMMYPRLKLARNLLTEDGVILISIDDNELVNLTKMCNEIIGEENFISLINRKTVEHMRVLADYEIQNLSDYVLVYSKNKNIVNLQKEVVGTNNYEYTDEYGDYTLKSFQNSGANGTRTARPNLYYPIFYNENDNKLSLEKDNCSIEILPKRVMNDDGRWLWSKEKFLLDNKMLEYKNGIIYRKVYFNAEDDQAKYRSLKNWLDEFPNRLGAKTLKDLDMQGWFDYSKPLDLLATLIKLVMDASENIILDFFSGSATTAHACLKLNAEDNGNRKFIMVQLPELCNDKSEVYNNGYKNICEIGQERIRRAGNKIKEETNADIDYGFRVYKVDSSNMTDVYHQPNELKQAELRLFEENIKEDRNSEDLLTQVILDLGLTLDLKIENKYISNNNVYFIADNSLIACFDNNININMIDEIVKYNPLKVVFRDSSFASDNDRINVEEKFKKYSPETEVSII